MPLREFTDPTTKQTYLKLVDAWGNPISGVGSVPQSAITVNPPQAMKIGGGTKDIAAAPARTGKTPTSVKAGITMKEPTYQSKTEQAYRAGKPKWVADQQDVIPEMGRAIGSIPFNITKSFAMLGEYIDDRKRQVFGEPRANNVPGFEQFYKTGKLPYGLDQGKLAGFGMTAWNALTRGTVLDTVINPISKVLTGRPVTPGPRSQMDLPGLLATPVKAFNKLSEQGGGIEPRTMIGGGVSEIVSFYLGGRATNVSQFVGKAPAVAKVGSAWSRAAALKNLGQVAEKGTKVAGSVDEIVKASSTLTRAYPFMGLPARSRDAQKLFGLSRAFPDFAARAATVAGAQGKLRQMAALGKQTVGQAATWNTVLDGAVYDLIKAVGTADQDPESLSQRLFRMSEPKRAAGSPLDFGRDARNIFWQTVDNLAMNFAGEALITGMRIAVPAMRLQGLKGAEYDAAFRVMADDPVLRDHLSATVASLSGRQMPGTTAVPTPKATALATDAPFISKVRSRASAVNPEAPPPPGPYTPKQGTPNPEAPPPPGPYTPKQGTPNPEAPPPPPPYRPSGDELVLEATELARAQTPKLADFPDDPSAPDFISRRAELLGTRPRSYVASILSADTNGVMGLDWNDAYSRAIREAQASGILRVTSDGDVYVPAHLAVDADEADELTSELVDDFAAANALNIDAGAADEALPEAEMAMAQQEAIPGQEAMPEQGAMPQTAPEPEAELAGLTPELENVPTESVLDAQQLPPAGAAEGPQMVDDPMAATLSQEPAPPEALDQLAMPTEPVTPGPMIETEPESIPDFVDLAEDLPEPEPTNPFELSLSNAEDLAPDPYVVTTQKAQQIRDFNLLAENGMLEQALNESPLTPFEVKFLATPEALADLAEFPNGELPEINPPFPAVLGGRLTVRVGADRLPARWAVVDLAQTPRSQTGTAGQFRDRSRAALQAQVGEMAADLHPDELLYSPRMDGGSPTMTADGVIVGGNGRADAIDLAYQNGAAGNYRQRMALFAKMRGIVPADYAGFERPAIVRVVQARGPEVQERLAIASNVATAQQSALELSRRDAVNLADLVLRFDDQGKVDLDASGVAVAKWMDRFERTERVPLTTADGAISPEGETRLRNAVLYQAYGDSRVLNELIEPTTESGRNLRNAIVRASGDVAALQQQIGMGQIPPEYAINTVLRDALDYFLTHGSELRAMARQQEMLNVVPYESRRIAVALADNNRSAKSMASIISRYVETVQQNAPVAGQSMLFGAPTSRADYLDQALDALVAEGTIQPTDPGLVDAMRRAAEPIAETQMGQPKPTAEPEASAVEVPAVEPEPTAIANARQTIESLNPVELQNMAGIYQIQDADQMPREQLIEALVSEVRRITENIQSRPELKSDDVREWLPADRDYSYFTEPLTPGRRGYKRELTRRQELVRNIPDMPAGVDYYPSGGAANLEELLKVEDSLAHYNQGAEALSAEDRLRRRTGQSLAQQAIVSSQYGEGDLLVVKDSAGRFAGALEFHRRIDEDLGQFILDIDLLGAVAPGSGAGSKLIGAVQAIARHEQAADLYIGMALSDAIEFYEAKGFRLVQGEERLQWARSGERPHMRMGENLYKSPEEIRTAITPSLVEVVAGTIKETQTGIAQANGIIQGIESQNLDEWAMLDIDHPDSLLRETQLEEARTQLFEIGDSLRETIARVARNEEKWGVYGQQLRELSHSIADSEGRIDDLFYRVEDRRQQLLQLNGYDGDDVREILDGGFPCE